MSGEEIFSIIFLIVLLGWIRIFFDDVANVVSSFKGIDDNSFNKNK